MLGLWISINCKFGYIVSMHANIMFVLITCLSWVIILHVYWFKQVWTLDFS